MKTLLLLRHAKASRDDPDLRDRDRPLTGRGRKAATRMGQLLAERRLVPDIILCSTARRARETLDGLAPALGGAPSRRFDEALYMAEPETLLNLVRNQPDTAETVLIVGHNPGLERLAGRLAGSGDAEARRRMAHRFPTAALAVLSFACDRWRDVAPSLGRLETFVTPDDLDE